MDHIRSKMNHLPKNVLSKSSLKDNSVTKEEYIEFMKRAVVKGTVEREQLYNFLLKTFQDGDVDRLGRVTPEAFDLMIESAAASPRRFGLAPKSHEMFQNAAVSKKKKIIVLLMYLSTRHLGPFGQEKRVLSGHGQGQ